MMVQSGGRELIVARVKHGKRLGFLYTLCIVLLRPGMLLWTKRDWRGAQHLVATPAADGSQIGIIVAANHISWFDPLQSAHFLYDNGRPPRYLAKEAVFRVPVVGRIIRGAGQIPVYRESADAPKALRAAVTALAAGECVVVYPEGTITRDPAMWPMTGKTGAARLALETGALLIPLAQWGAQEVMPPYRKRLRLLPRKTMRVLVGPPADHAHLIGLAIDRETLAIATDRVITAITSQLSQLRGEPMPGHRFDARRDCRSSGPVADAVSGECDDHHGQGLHRADGEVA